MKKAITVTKQYYDGHGNLSKTVITTTELEEELMEKVLKFLAGISQTP
jgi:hypothetical protein